MLKRKWYKRQVLQIGTAIIGSLCDVSMTSLIFTNVINTTANWNVTFSTWVNITPNWPLIRPSRKVAMTAALWRATRWHYNKDTYWYLCHRHLECPLYSYHDSGFVMMNEVIVTKESTLWLYSKVSKCWSCKNHHVTSMWYCFVSHHNATLMTSKWRLQMTVTWVSQLDFIWTSSDDFSQSNNHTDFSVEFPNERHL